MHMLSCSIVSPRYDWLTHWLLMIELNLQGLSLPQRLGGGMENSNPLITQLDHPKSKRVPEKHLLLLYWLCGRLWLHGSQQSVENSWRDGNTRPPDLPPEKSVCNSRSNSYNWMWNKRLAKKYINAVYCHPAYLTYMQSISWEMLGWMKHMLESRLLGEMSITSDMQMTPPLWKKVKKN